MPFLGNILKDRDEILFFVILFLLLFSGNDGKLLHLTKGNEKCDNDAILFFVILFLLLFQNEKRVCEDIY